MDGIAKLISEIFSSNEYGQRISTKAERQIFVTLKSVNRSEFFNAGRVGINPELVLVTPKINYNGEEIVKYDNAIYSIYRTFEDGEDIELYAQRRAGDSE